MIAAGMDDWTGLAGCVGATVRIELQSRKRLCEHLTSHHVMIHH